MSERVVRVSITIAIYIQSFHRGPSRYDFDSIISGIQLQQKGRVCFFFFSFEFNLPEDNFLMSLITSCLLSKEMIFYSLFNQLIMMWLFIFKFNSISEAINDQFMIIFYFDFKYFCVLDTLLPVSISLIIDFEIKELAFDMVLILHSTDRFNLGASFSSFD